MYQLEVQKIYLARVYRRQVYNIFIENKMEMKLEVRVLVHVLFVMLNELYKVVKVKVHLNVCR